jgi:hypothetical protein
MNPYIAQADVAMRLDGTYCMFDGYPCFVRVNKNFKCGEITVATLPYKRPDQEMLISIEDDRFSLVPPELGYVNTTSGCFFLSRLPDRIQKQGLSDSSVRVEGPGQNEQLRPGVSSLLNSESFVNACTNKYPSYKEALAGVTGSSAFGVAFSKTLAVARVDKNLIGLYKGMSLIGIFDKKHTLTLLDNGNHKIIRRMLTRYGVLM